MSHDATSWALKQRGFKPATKLVLWHLCDRYHPDHGCFPSQETLSNDCEMSRSALNDHLALLEDAGLILREQRRDNRSRKQLSTYYRFAFQADFPCPKSGHGQGETVSGKEPEPCPENCESRVRNSDTNLVRELVIEQVNERGVRDEISNSEKQEDRKSLERSFWKIVKGWPHIDGMPKDKWRAAWVRLTPAERIEAAEKRDAWLALLKANKRDNVPVPGTYFHQKLWKDVPDNAVKSSTGETIRKFEPKFGPVWGAKRMLPLFDAPRKDLPDGRNDFLRRLLREDSPLGEAERRKRRIEHGYPEVNKLDGGGVSNTCNPADERFREFAREWMVAVVVNSDVWTEWQSYFEGREWPWVPDTGRQPVVYFPKGGPAELSNFETAVRGLDNDDA